MLQQRLFKVGIIWMLLQRHLFGFPKYSSYL
jgi:hypothetical protein